MTLTPEQLAKFREDLDLFIKQNPSLIPDFDYECIANDFMWRGWLACQKSMVVEIPKEIPPQRAVSSKYKAGFNIAIKLVKSHLQSAGINYREKESV